MPLQTSPPLAFSQILAELVGSNVFASTLYRNGTYVIDIEPNASIPTSGGLFLSNFYGASAVGFGPNVILTSEVGNTFDGTAAVSITFNTNGTYEGNASFNNPGLNAYIDGNFAPRPWASGYGAGATPTNFWIYAETLVTGFGVLNGPRDTWLSLSSARTWSATAFKT